MKAIRITIAVCLLLVLLALALPVKAQVREADDFQLTKVEVYRHVLETNDQLYIFTHTEGYTTPPTYGTVSDNFIVQLRDGVNIRGTTTPYVDGPDSGYNLGISSIYFSAATVPAPGWAGAFTVYLQGNPVLQWMDTTAVTAMGGAIADDGGALTDETVPANEATLNDVHLLPVAPAVSDAFYFGATSMFDLLTVNIGTASAAWTGTIAWEYWNGTAWADLGETDGTNNWENAGNRNVTWPVPTSWQTTAVSGINQYWVRARIDVLGAGISQPLGTQSWTNALATFPSQFTATISWFDEGSVGLAQARLATRIRAIAAQLQAEWYISPLVPWTLLQSTPSGTVFTDIGESYFSNVIPGLREMCPSLFASAITTPDFTERGLVRDLYTGGDDATLQANGNNWFGQTFTALDTYPVNGFWFKALQSGVPGTVTGSLQLAVGNLPPNGGPDLASGTLVGADFTTFADGDWYWLTFTDQYTVTK
jgi:hypothetical protein